MSRRWVLVILAAGILSLPFLPRSTSASAKGPFPGFTGAPNEDTCRHCHEGFALNPQGGALAIDGFPETYLPGQRYTVNITLSSDSALRWGFQATALTADNRKAGKLLITDRVRTEKIRGYFITDRIYVQQKKAGSYPGLRGSATWSFDWQAPSTHKGPITMYVTGNAANDNGKTSGDLIYFTTATAQ